MEQNVPQMPPVQEVPTWSPKANIEMNGAEFETVFNFIASAQNAMMAVQSVMNKNILNGTVKLSFNKLVTDTNGKQSYVPMTPEESAPYEADLAKMIEQIKNPQPIVEEKASGIVDLNGNDIPTTQATPVEDVLTVNVLQEEAAPETPNNGVGLEKA